MKPRPHSHRSEKNLPLFATGPIVVAEAEKPPRHRARHPPTAVVDATPSEAQAAKGQAVLVLAANPPRRSSFHHRSEPPPSPAGAYHDERTAPASGVSGQSSSWNSRVGLAAGHRRAIVMAPRWSSFRAARSRWATMTGQAAEKPAHQVRLSTYYIDQHEVTNRQFRTFFLTKRTITASPPENG